MGAEVDFFSAIAAFAPVTAMRMLSIWLELLATHPTMNPRSAQALVMVEGHAGVVVELTIAVTVK